MGEEKKIPEAEKKKAPEEEAEKKKVPEEGEKKVLEETPPPPEETPKPEPPPEILMRVYMHCEGCARKVRRCLKGFDGVEEVITDCKTHKVVVKGEKADPMKVLERVQKKTHRQVELLSPIPPPKQPSEEDKKTEDKETPKPKEEKKQEPKVVTVVLKVHMHCEACALEIKKRIERMKEVEEATPDLKSSEVSVKGTFAPPKLVEYIHKRTGKHAIIVKQDPPPPEDDKGKDGNKDEKKGEDEANKGDENKGKEEGKGSEKSDSAGNEAAGAGEDEVAKAGMEVKRNEYYFQNYPPRYAMETHDAYPPQIFSDENPNACSIM